MLFGKFLFKLTGTVNASIGLRHLGVMEIHIWRASLKKFCRLKVLLIQFFPVALSVIFFACVCEVQLRLCVGFCFIHLLERVCFSSKVLSIYGTAKF